MGLIEFYVAAVALVFSAIPGTVHSETFLGFELLQLDGARVKWDGSKGGQPPVVTYALVEDSQSFPNARNCSQLVSVQPALANSHIEMDRFKTELEAAFAMWAKVANIEFREVAAGEMSNIVIGAQGSPTGYAFTDVHYKSGEDAVRTIDRSLICLNPERQWKIGFDGNLLVYDLRYTIAHEIGHAIGLDHPSASGQLMSFRYDEHFRQLQEGDIRGVTQIYGTNALK